jgi:hypothetical protein
VHSAEEISQTAKKVQATVNAVLKNEMAPTIKKEADAKNTAHRIFTGIVGKLDDTCNGLEQFNRMFSLLSGWSLGLMSENDAAIAATPRERGNECP